MDKEIRIRITTDGKVEVDSTVFSDCTEVANHLAGILGKVESFKEKDHMAGDNMHIKIDGGD